MIFVPSGDSIMEREDFHILRLMGEVDRNGSRTQRELSRRLNVSVGLVNAFMKRLIEKGYFKAKTMPQNRLKYLLTPRGLAEKSRLTIEYLGYSVNFYREVKDLLLKKFEKLEELGIKSILFMGTGEVAELAYLYLQLTGIRLLGIVDERGNGRSFFGFRVEGVSRLDIRDWDCILVARLDDPDGDVRVLLENGIELDRIVTL